MNVLSVRGVTQPGDYTTHPAQSQMVARLVVRVARGPVERDAAPLLQCPGEDAGDDATGCGTFEVGEVGDDDDFQLGIGELAHFGACFPLPLRLQ